MIVVFNMTTTTLIVNDQQQLQKQALKKLDELILHQKQWCSKQRNPSPSEERERERRYYTFRQKDALTVAFLSGVVAVLSMQAAWRVMHSVRFCFWQRS